MLKKLLCVLLAVAVIFATFGGCAKPPVETVKVAKAASVANFAAYKEDIIAIIDKEKVQYDFSEFSAGNEEGSPEIAPYFYIMKIALKDEPGTEINIGLTNENQIESFTITIVVTKPTIKDCDLNINDYSYLRKVFNLVSEIKVSAFACNRLMRSMRRGSEDEYALNPKAFYKKKEKFFAQDKTKTWSLQYTIYYNTTKDPAVFEETLDFKGILAQRAAS